MLVAPKIREIPFAALGAVFDEADIEAAMRIIRRRVSRRRFFPLPEESEFQQALAGHEGAQASP